MFSHNSICRMFPMKILLSNVITVTKYKFFGPFFLKNRFFLQKNSVLGVAQEV